MDPHRIEQIKRASIIAIVGNTILALIKIILGLFSDSLAVVSDGIDSSTDIVASLVILFAAHIIALPPDREHPYGHGRAESIASRLVAFVIFFAGAQIALSTTQNLITGTIERVPSPLAIYTTVASLLGKILLAVNQLRLGRKSESQMIIANGKNMLNDIYISGGILVGLVFTIVLKVPVLDSVLAIAVRVWVMKSAVQIFIESNTEVMESVRDPGVYDQIFGAVSRVEGASNPHRTRIRQIANLYVIELDVEIDPKLTVAEAHKITFAVEEEIKSSVRNVYDIIVHVEPQGNEELEEKYGRSAAESD